jgi:hypothetical protein
MVPDTEWYEYTVKQGKKDSRQYFTLRVYQLMEAGGEGILTVYSVQYCLSSGW